MREQLPNEPVENILTAPTEKIFVEPEVVVLGGMTGILVPGENDHPGVRFWVQRRSSTEPEVK